MKSVVYKDISADNLQFRAWLRGSKTMLEWDSHRREILALMFARPADVDFMQWIGMLDDTDPGVKIFEQDIVEAEVYSGFGSIIMMKGIVAFDPSQSGYKIHFPNSTMGKVNIGKVRVIGDICRNQDLWDKIKESGGGQQESNGSQKIKS